MAASMERLDHWLETHLPELHTDLLPGASDVAIAEFEALVGRPFPDSLKALYKWHDGQEDEINTGPFYGLTFLSLAEARKHWEGWKQIVDDSSPEDMAEASDFCSSARPGAVKALYANAYWVPFAYDYGGNHLGVDLDPGENGTVGQVINYGRDEEEKFVVASSVATFLDWLANQLESGNFVIRDEDDGGRSLNTRDPEKFHFLDSVAILFAEQREGNA